MDGAPDPGQHLQGGCACGAIRFAVAPGDWDIADCHCRMCQRAVGAASVTWLTASAAAVRLVAGTPRWWRSSPRAERGFCAACGTSLLFRAIGGGESVDLCVASFDDPSSLGPARHIWTASRQPWVHTDPALPHHADGGPDWSPPLPSSPVTSGLR